MSANLGQSRSKCNANDANATFALDLHGGGKSWCKCGIYPICTTFATALGPDLLAFAPRKFGVNPFFRQKSKGSGGREGGVELLQKDLWESYSVSEGFIVNSSLIFHAKEGGVHEHSASFPQSFWTM